MLPRRPVNPAPKPDTAKPEGKKAEEADRESQRDGAANAGEAKPDPIGEMDTKILAQVKADEPELKANLQYLADHIGPRLTGSKQLELAGLWMMERFQQIGLANVHQEPWTIANRWTRGPATGRIFLSGEKKTGGESGSSESYDGNRRMVARDERSRARPGGWDQR